MYSSKPNVNLNDVAEKEDDTKEPAGKFEKLAMLYFDELMEQRRFPLYTGQQFFTWTGTHYRRTDELPMLVRDFMKRHNLGQSNNVVGNVVPIVQAYAWRCREQFGPMPFWAGDNPPFRNPESVLTFANGLLDLDAGTNDLIPHDSRWCCAGSLPFRFNPAAECPNWMRFLGEVFEGDRGREDLLAEFIGYCLTWDTRHQKALLMVGPPRSGKGTIMHILGQLVGHGFTGFRLQSLVTDFGMSALVNKQVAGVGEVELKSEPRWAQMVERLKGIIGEDVQEVNTKHEAIRSERLRCRFVVSANSNPPLFDSSGALAERMLPLPFKVSFLGREDVGLAGRLETELPGICNWALAGLRRLRERGRFQLPDESRKAAERFAAISSPTLAFVRSKLLVDRRINPGHLPAEALTDDAELWTPTPTLWNAYSEWCHEVGVEPRDTRFFSADLLDVLPRVARKQRSTPNGRAWGYTGLTLRSAPVQ